MIECTVCGRFVGDSAGKHDAEDLALHLAEYHTEQLPVADFAGERKTMGHSETVESIVDQLRDHAGGDE
jgi:hypothetical protein